MIKTVLLLGVNVSQTDPIAAVRQICAWVKAKEKTYVCVAPVATLVDAKRNPQYLQAVNGAGMVTPDGMPVVWLARLRGCKTIERTYGPDLMLAVCNHGQDLGLKHFFYGGTNEVLKKLEQKLVTAYPQIQIAGMYAPPFKREVWQESPEIIDRINTSGADIVWVGIGSPKQDFWMQMHRPLLTAPVIVGAGAAFDFLSGAKPQAPRWMMNAGLEWFFRFCSEPGRLWKRYLIGNSLFIFYALTDSMRKKIMKSRWQAILITCIYMVLDVACIMLAFYGVLRYRPQTVAFKVISLHSIFSAADPFRILFVVWPLLILFLFYTHNLYRTRREQGESLEMWEVVKSIILSTLLVVVIAFLSRTVDFPRSVMILNAMVIAFFCSMWRVFKRIILNYLVANGYNNFNTLIIGAGKTGVSLAHEIRHRPSLGLKIKGFLDDNKTGTVDQWPVLGTLKSFPQILHREFIQQIYITIYPEHDSFIKLLEIAQEEGLAVRVVPKAYEYMSDEFVKFNIGLIPILEYSNLDDKYHHRLKRFFDILLSLLAMIVLLPFFLILGILIKLDNPGPVFYKSRRYGRYGRMFDMYKFRSMVSNADDLLCQLKHKNEVDGPIFKIRKDPRITNVGAFLRRYSLDELPQILNVLKGDMSLVGPRPFPTSQLEKEDLRQLKRLGIRPGITGLWQIRGRSDVSFEKLLRWDIWYIKNWSFWLDLYILFQTFPVVIKGKGAY